MLQNSLLQRERCDHVSFKMIFHKSDSNRLICNFPNIFQFLELNVLTSSVIDSSFEN